jgi:hypothetical protein
MELNKIEQLFAAKAIIRPGTFLLKPIDAIDFVSECQKQEINILGVDAFYLIEEKIQPSLMHSVDFTSLRRHESDINVYDAAQKLIEAANDMYFEIVIDC